MVCHEFVLCGCGPGFVALLHGSVVYDLSSVALWVGICPLYVHGPGFVHHGSMAQWSGICPQWLCGLGSVLCGSGSALLCPESILHGSMVWDLSSMAFCLIGPSQTCQFTWNPVQFLEVWLWVRSQMFPGKNPTWVSSLSSLPFVPSTHQQFPPATVFGVFSSRHQDLLGPFCRA